MVLRFEQLHDISYIIEAIDGSLNLVLTPMVGKEDYYSINLFIQPFYRELLNQTICSRMMNLIGHEVFTIDFFHITKIRHAYLKYKFQTYKFIGDVA